MVNNDLNEELSDSDSDDLFREDIEALTRACLPTTLNTSSPAVGILYDDDDDDDDDDDFDDLELVRSIQARYGEGRVADDIKPLTSLPPPVSDDDDDDYEFYQAIKARFSLHHDADDATDANKKNDVNSGRDESVSNDVGASFGREFVDEHIEDDAEQYDTTEKEGAFTPVSSFPLTAQTFIDAIKKNRACQKFIRNKLLHIEAKMEQINELHKRIKTIRDYQVQCKKQVGLKLSQKQDDRIQLISAAKHRANAKGREICYGPAENSYVVWYKAALQKYPLSFHREKWSNKDIQNLEKGIVRQYQEKLLQRQAHDDGIDAMMLSVKNHKITPETIQCFADEVNWTQLATIYLPRRSGEECETRWLNRENHLKNSDHWTKAEEVKLLSLIEKNGFNSWTVIAQHLGTNRTPFECLAHYQRSLNASILKKAWTDDEDAKLNSAVELYGDSNWQAVASMFEGRTGPQCSNRWNKTLNPARKRVGRWNDDEDKRLKVAATLFRRSWHRIAKFVPGRTQEQCRERWVNCLNPCLNRCEWTAEEDTKLREAITQHGYCWSKVATCVPMRTDNHCLRRWKMLCPYEFPQIEAARTIQKLALISNFVGREEERPTLEPKDFVSLPIEDSKNEENGTGKKNRKRRSSNKKKTAEKKQKKSKVKTEELEGWEDLPLSVLFDKAFSRRR
ncbi:uncharacterized protein LOC141646730 [Silene latifolia]|uniref:uncharacterized protein LOC141646730 n=1 Tax=Silene latifolia TaxID=37657 RepID=UPI003D77A4F2